MVNVSKKNYGKLPIVANVWIVIVNSGSDKHGPGEGLDGVELREELLAPHEPLPLLPHKALQKKTAVAFLQTWTGWRPPLSKEKRELLSPPMAHSVDTAW